MRIPRQFLIWLVVAALCGGCASTESRFAPLSETSYPPRPVDAEVAMFTQGFPARSFVRIARLDVHLEKTGFITSSLQDAIPELKKQTRLAGGDAIIEIREQRSSVGETRIYHVTATAIRYMDD